MKKKGKKRFSKKIKNLRKKLKIKKKRKLRKINKRILRKQQKRIKKTKKRSLKRQKRKSRKIKKITSEIKLPNFDKQIDQFKKLSFRKVIGFIFKPLIKAFGDYRQKKKLEKLKKINLEIKKREKNLNLKEKLREDLFKQEIKQEEKIARLRERDLRQVLQREQKIIRQIQKNKEKKFTETLKIQKQLERFAKREQAEILNLEKIGVNLEREEYRQLQERIDRIRQRYIQLRNERIKKRVEELTGKTFSDQASIEEIKKQEKDIIEQKEHISSALESYYRSIKTVLHSVNFKYLPRHAELLRVYDLRYEQSEIVVREDSETENFLLLVYLEDNNPNGKIIVEDKCNDEKHITRNYSKNQIFQFGDDLIDSVLGYLERLRMSKKKAS